MPPKGKSEKQKKDNDMPKAQLWEEYVTLREKVESVRKQKNNFKMERDKVQRSWDISKRNLEETRARMREKLRLKQEAEKCRQAETEEHEQKLKQLETAHHSEICGLKMAAFAKSSKTQKEHVESEVELRKELLSLQAEKREEEGATKTYLERLERKQQEELRELNESYEKQVREMEAQFNKTMKTETEEHTQNTLAMLKDVDLRMKQRVASLVEEHDKAVRVVNVFIEKNERVCLERKKLERVLEALQEKIRRTERREAAAVQKNVRLREAERDIESKTRESRQEQDVQRQAMTKSLKRSKKITVRVLQERRELCLKQQQLEMKYEQLQQDFDELQKKETETVLSLQMEIGLEEMVLERKIKAVTEMQEKEQLKLWVALTFGLGDQTAAKKIKELLESKRATINTLKGSVSQDLKEYDDLAKKATALGISFHNRLPMRDIKKSIRNASEDKDFDSLMQKVTALCLSEDNSVQGDNSVQEDALGLNPAGAESRQ